MPRGSIASTHECLTLIEGFGRRLRAARDKTGRTLASVAGAIGCAPSSLSSLETDRSVPSVALLVLLAQELGVSIDELLLGQ